jgi:hypothetical protein
MTVRAPLDERQVSRIRRNGEVAREIGGVLSAQADHRSLTSCGLIRTVRAIGRR